MNQKFKITTITFLAVALTSCSQPKGSDESEKLVEASTVENLSWRVEDLNGPGYYCRDDRFKIKIKDGEIEKFSINIGGTGFKKRTVLVDSANSPNEYREQGSVAQATFHFMDPTDVHEHKAEFSFSMQPQGSNPKGHFLYVIKHVGSHTGEKERCYPEESSNIRMLSAHGKGGGTGN